MFTLIFINGVNKFFSNEIDDLTKNEVANPKVMNFSNETQYSQSLSKHIKQSDEQFELLEAQTATQANSILAPVIQSLPVPRRGHSRTKSQDSIKQELNYKKNANLHLHVVCNHYAPQYYDEIPLDVGDIVLFKRFYDDNWGFGINLTKRSKDGCFPLHYCKPMVESLIPAIDLSNESNMNSFTRISSGVKSSFSNVKFDAITVLKAVLPYERISLDEIDLAVGDCIETLKIFDDGWGFGKIIESASIGFFPLNFCVIVSTESNSSDSIFSSIQRTAHRNISWLIKNPISPNELKNVRLSPKIKRVSFLDNLQLQISIDMDLENENKSYKISEQSTISRTSSLNHPCLPPIVSEHVLQSQKNYIYSSNSKSDPRSKLFSSSHRYSPLLSDFEVSPEDDLIPNNLNLPEVIVKKKYCAIQPDEISIFPEDQIFVLQTFDDGWALGLSVEQRLVGIFPLSFTGQAI
ncbi:hypothetical protein HK096_008218 [Nowakowskiella sp. JEL0078]|nr:hypothetical protein HK096_008218 [Nowakowskiella sp. JEL0078]